MTASPEPDDPAGSAGLLLVEANDVDAERLRSLLGEAWLGELGVRRTRRLAEARNYLTHHSPGCVLAALKLPDANGLDVVAGLVRANPEVPIVVLGDRHEEAVAIDAVAHGAQEYLLKPYTDTGALSRAIRYAVERRRAELQDAYESMYDAVTGLPNSAYLQLELELALSRAQNSGHSVAVYVVALDDLELVRETLGEHRVDELLFELGARLQDSLRPRDILARIRADEFAVLCEEVDDDERALELGRRLADQATSRSFQLGEEEVSANASVGVARSGAANEAAELTRNASAAAHRAREGVGGCGLFRREMRDVAVRRLKTQTGLRHALERGELEVYYQLQFNLQDGRPVGAEALLRWHHPDHGLMGPLQFIEVAENTGLIVPMGAHVLEIACRDACRWREANGGPVPNVSVNLSTRQLADPELYAAVERALATSGLPPTGLCLEVTERIAMDRAGETGAALAELKRLGVTLALDDFGTGYSSLSYLDRLPIDLLKLDRAVVSEVDRDPRKQRIVAAVAGLAGGLGLSWLAEGVEREDEAARLRELDCELVQGFLFARPAPFERIRQLLRDGSQRVERERARGR